MQNMLVNSSELIRPYLQLSKLNLLQLPPRANVIKLSLDKLETNKVCNASVIRVLS